MVSADLLVVLSDIDGLYTANPQIDPGAEFIPEVHGEISAEIEGMAGVNLSGDSKGGMVTKLAAAKIAMGAGAKAIIALGTEPHPLKRILDGARATLFVPNATPRSARKEWIAGSLSPSGRIIVDAGALNALKDGKSLLPAGVRGIKVRSSAGMRFRLLILMVVKSREGWWRIRLTMPPRLQVTRQVKLKTPWGIVDGMR